MVLTATVAKARVAYALPGLWNLVMHLDLRDGANVAIDADYFAELSEGETIESKSSEIIDAMQVDIDQYLPSALHLIGAILSTKVS